MTRKDRQREDETNRVEARRQLDAERRRQQEAAGAASKAEWMAALKLWGGLTPEQQESEVAALMRQPRWKLAGEELAREFAIRSMLKRSN